MARSNRLGMYADIREILDKALSSGGGTMCFETYGSAVHWTQRVYKFRKLYAETLGADRESPYDRLTFRRPDKITFGVVIAPIGHESSKFIPDDGPAVDVPDEDDLLRQAKDLLGE